MRQILIFLLCQMAMIASGQEISCDFHDVSMPDALRNIQEQATQYDIIFIYNDLEDFRVTTDVHQKSVMDAIIQIVGFYPVRVYEGDSREIYVECTHKTERRLTGTIVDEQGQPVSYANIAVLNPADSTLLGGGVSNESGYFAIPYDQEEVLVRISHVGYKTIHQLFDKSEVGMVRMQMDALWLKGVTVKGQAPVLRREAGAIIFDTRYVAGAINAKDLLQYAPGVMVRDDNVSLFGTSGIIFCINGKEQKIQARDMLQLLQTYPASDIERIEMIQSPGARYAAEGNAGVINFVLHKHGNDFIGGTMAYARTQFEEHGDETNASFIYNKGRISTSLNLAGIWDHTLYRETNTIGYTDTERLNIDDGHISKENYTLRWQMDYQALDRLNLGAYVMYADGERHLTIDGLYDYQPKVSHSVSRFATQTHRKEDTKTWAMNINAVQRVGKEGAKIDYNLDYYRMKMGDSRHSVSYGMYTGDSPEIIFQSDTTNFDYKNNIAQTIDNYSAKVDFSYDGFRLGSQYVYTRSHLDLAYSGTNASHSFVSTFYDEQVWAGYAEYGRTFGNAWSLNIGGRYEHTWTKGDNRPIAYESRSDYGRFFPSLHVGYHPNSSHAFSWSLSSRITRPNMINLNPNWVWQDVNHVSFGNQHLKPSYLYKAMMGYTYQGVLNFDLYYAYQPDRVDAVYSVDKQVTYNSWDNITDEYTFGVNSFYYFGKLRWMTATLMQGICYSKTVRSSKERIAGLIRQYLHPQVENISYTGMLQTSFFFDRDHKWMANLNATYTSCEKDVAKKVDACYMVDVGLRHSFWKDRLAVGLVCRNLLASHIKGEEYLSTQVMAFNNKFNYRQLHLTLTYNWGARLRHDQRRYESDDMQERIVNDF